jgi:hypothetical protein
MNRKLDDFLSQPLAEMPDEGFSARVQVAIARQNIRRTQIEAVMWIVLALAATTALAISRPGRELAALALSLNIAAQMGVALTVLLLIFAFREAAE